MFREHRQAVTGLWWSFIVSTVIAGFVLLAGQCAVRPTVVAAHGHYDMTLFDLVNVVPISTTGYHCPKGGRSGQCDPLVDDGLTSTLRPVREGLCAADVTRFPYGTILVVPGYGACEVQDIGAKIKGTRVDLYFSTLERAVKWGVRDQKAIVLYPGWEETLK